MVYLSYDPDQYRGYAQPRQNQLHSIAHNLSLDIPVFHQNRFHVNIPIRNQLCDLCLIRLGMLLYLREVLAEPEGTRTLNFRIDSPSVRLVSACG